MQIIPDQSSFNSYGIYSSGYEWGSSSSFMDAMDTALDAVNDGSNHSVSSALQDESNGPLVESPYTRHTTDGITYTLGEVCFSKNELLELRQALLKEGAPVESLSQFDILASQPDGATLAQVMASLMGKSGGVQISEQDAQTITGLLGQIDPSGQLAEDALGLMRNGNGAAALELVQDALAGLGADELIDVDPEALVALGRGLGLNKDALNGLVNNFGGRSGLTLNGSQFDAMLNPAKNFLMEEASRSQKLDAALDKTLRPIISKARDRMEKEKAANALQDRRVEQSKILIDNTVQKNSRQTIDDTMTGQGELETAIRREAAERLAYVDKHMPEKDEPGQAQQPDRQLMANAADRLEGRFFRKDASDSNSGFMDQQKSERDGWQTLLDKVQVKAPVQTQTANPVVYAAVQGNLEAPVQASPLLNSQSLPAYLSSQVEQGMLTAMRDGSTRLDLQLHPQELGNISITLIARNGEVTAQLRSEKSETAEILTRQLDSILANLEQQGIKVDKIEVAMENRQESAQDTFQDLFQHNARQEEDARRQELARMRNLASLRNIGTNEVTSGLAQSMQENGHAVRNAGHALHAVA